MKKSQGTPNTIMEPTYMQYFDKVYMSDGVKTALSTHGLGKIKLIVSVRTGRIVIKTLQTSILVLLAKIVSNVNLKTSTILAKD